MVTEFLAERLEPRRAHWSKWQIPLLACWGAIGILLLSHPARGITHGKAQTGKDVQREAAQLIPWSRLEPQTAAQVRKVIEKPCMFRRMPTEVIQCDGDLFRFLTRYPEVVVNIWQLMGITKVSAHRTGPSTFSACDGAGTNTDVHLVYGDDKLQVLYCDGNYQGPLFKRRLVGRCVLVIASGSTPSGDGNNLVTARMDVFLQVDDLGIDVLTRTLHPLLGKSADRNFAETLAFVEKISRTAQENGPGMGRLASRLTGVDADIRQQFAERTMTVYQKNLTQLAMPPEIDAPSLTPVGAPNGDMVEPQVASRISIRSVEPRTMSRAARSRP